MFTANLIATALRLFWINKIMKMNCQILGLAIFLGGCAVPERGDPVDILLRIHANTNALEHGYVRSESDKVEIWYIGSDADRHYFGEYKPSKPRIFSDEIVFAFLMRNEISVQKEQMLSGKLSHSCNLDEVAHGDWKWPVKSIQNSYFKEKQVVVEERKPKAMALR